MVGAAERPRTADATVPDLQGRVALVTGGGRGLGAAICRDLAAAGLRVIAADVRTDLAETLADELSVEQWDQVMAVNLRGPFVLAHFVLPQMRRQGTGNIINIVSTAAKRAWPNASVYHASKWGLLGLSHALHAEARVYGVKVTALISGGMRTPFLLDRFPDIDPGVLQDPANVARTIRFILAQPEDCVIPEMMVIPMREGSWP